MEFCFTAAAERALACASAWRSGADRDELHPEALLVGLLAEPECRAATLLAKLAVDIAVVRRQWPTLVEDVSMCGGDVCRQPFSTDVQCSLQLASQRLTFLPRPPEMATEHVLLGLAVADHEVSIWLRQRGLDPDALEAEICKLYGHQIEEERGEWRVERDEFSPGVLAGESPLGTFSPGADAGESLPCQQTAALRVLDAAANRAREGLRAIEDYVRFVLDDRHLTGLCKQLRHDLTNALSRIALDNLLAARETQADVGTTLATSSEQRREDATGVLRANFARLQESLRSLEEFGKLLDAGMAETLKQLRYRAYTLQRAVEITRGGIERLASVRLYVLVGGRRSPEEFERLVRSLIGAGAGAIQLRDKRLGDRELLGRARLLRTLTNETETLFVMNDRPDLAALAEADGVHVGQEEISVKDARRIVGPEALVGVSTHSIQQARQAVLDGANYLGVGPVFPSGTKRFERFPGVELLRAVAAEIRLPAFAIGGIDRANLAEVLAAGFTRVAVGGAITSAADPAEAIRELLLAFNGVEGSGLRVQGSGFSV